MKDNRTGLSYSRLVVCLACLFTIFISLGAALPARAVGTYELTKVADNLPRDLQSVGRLTYGNVDRLLYGEWTKIWWYEDTWAGVLHLADLRGPYNWYSGIFSVFSHGNTIYATPNSNGQGCKLEILTVDEDGNIVSTERQAFEWTHADHDSTDQGVGAKDPRNGRLILGYGNPHRESEAPDWEAGRPLAGLVMEYGQPTPDQWDCWTNQLEVDGATVQENIGLMPHSFVSLEDNQLLVAAHGNDGKTYFPLIQGVPWDGPTPDGPGDRAPQRQGYWSFVKHPSGADLSLSGLRDVWDPYSEGGEFNDIYFVFGGDVLPSYFKRSDPSTRYACRVFHSDGQGGWSEAGWTEGETQAGAVHPVSNKPIVVASLGSQGMGVYEAAWDDDGRLALYRVATVDDSGHRALLVHAYKDSVFIATGGNLYRLQAK